MSLPSFILTPAEHSEALQPAFKTRKLAHGWAVPTSITADPVPSHAEEPSNTIQSPFLPLQAADSHMLQPDPQPPCIGPRMMDYAATADGYMFPVTSEGENAPLDAWLHVPDCQPEPSIYQTVTAQQNLAVFQPLWPPEAAVFEPSSMETFSAIPYPQTPISISANLETMKQDMEQYQLPSVEIPPPESIAQPAITLPNHAESKGKRRIARGQIIDEVLNALRQMDYNIRAVNRQHLADIATSSLT